MNKNTMVKKVKNYTMFEKIGGGNFGEVWKAINENTKEILAVKIVKKASLQKNFKVKELFKSELKNMSMLKNKNIVELKEYLESEINCYIIMEYCNQGDLDQYLKKYTYLSENEAVEKLRQLLNGFKGN